MRQSGSWKWCLLLLIYPFWFVGSRLYLAHRSAEDFDYVLCIRLHGDLQPVPISVLHAWDFIILCFGVLMVFCFLLVAKNWRERRIFYGIIAKLRGGSEHL